MNFFGPSWALANNLKVAFFEKFISKDNCAIFISSNQYDRLTHQSFLEAAASLGNTSERKVSILLRLRVCKNFTDTSQPNTAGQCQIY